MSGFDDAVDALVRCAESAGVAASAARAEAAAVRDFVVEGDPTAAHLRDRPSEALAGLVAAQSALAASYARALVDVAAAATSSPDVSLDALTRASALSSAQLRSSGAIAPELGSLLRTATGTGPDVGSSSPVGSPTGPGGTAAATAPPAPAAAEPELEPARPVAELLAELDDLVGLEGVKEEVHRQAALLRMAQLREGAGLKRADITRHLVFNGNPGTGKTTVARLVAGIYRSLGVLPKGQLVECDRSELVAGYVGQTAIKTAEVIDRAIGGVLFIDEAYALADDEYGDEAIATLVKGMEDHRDELVVIVAGYPGPMAGFIATNPGLKSRFRLQLDFADLTDDQLVEIFTKMARGADFTPTAGCLDRVYQVLAAAERGEGFGNARFIRNVFEAAVVHHAWRLREVEAPSEDEMRTLLEEDVEG